MPERLVRRPSDELVVQVSSRPGSSRRGGLGHAIADDRHVLSRLLAAGGLAATASLTGCSLDGEQIADRPKQATGGRHRYGLGEDQFGDLYLPKDTPRGTVVSLHGGYWYAQYGLDLMQPICTRLRDEGFAVWNLEYRRIDGGGGWPTTFEDVAAGIDRLDTLDGVDRQRVVFLSLPGRLHPWQERRRRAEGPGDGVRRRQRPSRRRRRSRRSRVTTSP